MNFIGNFKCQSIKSLTLYWYTKEIPIDNESPDMTYFRIAVMNFYFRNMSALLYFSNFSLFQVPLPSEFGPHRITQTRYFIIAFTFRRKVTLTQE